MRVTVTISDKNMDAIACLTKAKTKTAAINQALVDWVRMKHLQELRGLRGKLEIADDLAGLRALDE